MNSRKEEKIVQVNVADLKEDMYVRKQLDDDRVWSFAQLFANGKGDTIPPIQITSDFFITYGRHRKAGAILADQTTIRAVIKDGSRLDRLERAIMENVDPKAPFPMTKIDMVFCIRQLIQENMKKVKIFDLMCRIIPHSTVQALYDEARHAIYRDNLREAKFAVIDEDVSIPAAAKQFNIPVETLRLELNGGKKMKGSKKVSGPGEFNRLLSTQFRSHGQKVRKAFEALEKAHENGDISNKQVLEVYEYAIKSARQKLNDLVDKCERVKKDKDI